MTDIKLYGRVFISGNIEAITGLHIGGAEEAISIGGVENTVIRDPLSQIPYIPGSSLKGKMRSLMEKLYERPQNTEIGQATIHTCKSGADYAECRVCQLYGAPSNQETKEREYFRPTRLIVRDVMLEEKSAQALRDASTDLPYTEVKWEVAIDRVTSAANPRPMERVPAGAVFGPFQFVFSLYEPGDDALIQHILEGMSLLQDDYLGGSGTRGSGRIAFTDMRVEIKSSANYQESEMLGPFPTLEGLREEQDAIKQKLAHILNGNHE